MSHGLKLISLLKAQLRSDIFYRLVLAMLLPLLALSFVLSDIRQPMSDGYLRFETFKSLWEAPIYSKYSTVQPIIAKILDDLLRVFDPSIAVDFVPKFFDLFLVLIFLGVSLVFFNRSVNILMLGSLLPLSMMTHYFGQFFSEITSSTLIALGFVIFNTQPNRLGTILGSLIAAIGLANWSVLLAPTSIVFLASVVGVFLRQKDSINFSIFIFLSLSFGVVLAIGDLVLKSQLLDNPYNSSSEAGFTTVMPYSGLPGFSHPVLLGLLGSLFSFGKSIFLFNPFVIFLFIRQYDYKIFSLAFLFTTLIIYSQWWAWYGGFSFGTRFYIFTVIPSIYVFIDGLRDENRQWKWLEIFVLGWAFWLAICGKYFGLDATAGICAANDYALEAYCWYVPEFTPLINPFVTYGIGGIIEYLSWIDYFYFLTMVTGYLLLTKVRTGLPPETRH